MYSSQGHLVMSPRIKHSIVQYKLAHAGPVRPEALYESLRQVHQEVSLEDVIRWMHSWSWIEEADLVNDPPQWCTRLLQIYQSPQNTARPIPYEREPSSSGRTHVKRKRSSIRQWKEKGVPKNRGPSSTNPAENEDNDEEDGLPKNKGKRRPERVRNPLEGEDNEEERVSKKLEKDLSRRFPSALEKQKNEEENDVGDQHGAGNPPELSRRFPSPSPTTMRLTINAPRSEASANSTRAGEIPSSSIGLRTTSVTSELLSLRYGNLLGRQGRMQDLVNPPQMQENWYQNQNEQQNMCNILDLSRTGTNRNHSIGQQSLSQGSVSPHLAQSTALAPFNRTHNDDPCCTSNHRIPRNSADAADPRYSIQELSAIVQRINQNLNAIAAPRSEATWIPAPRNDTTRTPVPSVEQAQDAHIANISEILRSLTAQLGENPANASSSTNAGGTSRSAAQGFAQSSSRVSSNLGDDLNREDDETNQLHRRELSSLFVMFDLIRDLRLLIDRSDRAQHTLSELDPIFQCLIRSLTRMVYPRGIWWND